MLHALKALQDCEVAGIDGHVGHVKDFYFDDHEWVIRYLVVETGSWLASRKVLLSPRSIRSVDWFQNRLSVSLTQEQIKNSPGIDADKPVSRQYELDYSGYYAYPYYWGGYGIWGEQMYPDEILAEYPDSNLMQTERAEANNKFAAAERARHRDDDPNLRSCKEVTGYHVHAIDGAIGHIESFLMDEKTWSIRYVVVYTSNWWVGRKVLVAPQWITQVRWPDESVNVGLSRDAVRDAPLYDVSEELNRQREVSLYEYYNLPGYWTDSRLYPGKDR